MRNFSFQKPLNESFNEQTDENMISDDVSLHKTKIPNPTFSGGAEDIKVYGMPTSPSVFNIPSQSKDDIMYKDFEKRQEIS